MSDGRLSVNLDVMRRAATSALAFVEGMSRDDFLADEKTQAATVMMLITIGEAAVRIHESSPDFVQERNDWPWTQMRAMRNRGAHAYSEIVFEVIWDTVQLQLPPLLRQLESVEPTLPES